MRQSNQKSRSRGRGRKPQNPMSRNFESNGPDVKIRGNAAHIAEKYSTLARDSLSSGETVNAENYFQHAEHYNRIVAAAQQQSDARAAEMAEKRRSEQSAENLDGENASEEMEAKEISNADVSEDSNQEEAPKQAEAPRKEQKSGRTRRPRKPAVAEASNDDAQGEPSNNNEEVGVSAEVISEDAAKLPEGLLGGVGSEEG